MTISGTALNVSGLEVDFGLQQINPVYPDANGHWSSDYLYFNDTSDYEGGVGTIIARAMDYQGNPVTATASITIHNRPPLLTVVDPSPAAISEGEGVTIVVGVDDPGIYEMLTVTVDWGDGTSPATFERWTPWLVGPSEWLTHVYLDEGPSPGNTTPQDTHTITVTATDDDGGVTVETRTVRVNNVKPTAIPDAIPAFHEGETRTITGQVIDPGVLDTVSVIIWIDWNMNGGEDAGETGFAVVTGAPGSQQRSFSYTVLVEDDGPSDLPWASNGTSADAIPIRFRAWDDDMSGDPNDANPAKLPTETQSSVTVHNVEPALDRNSVGFSVTYNEIDDLFLITVAGHVSDAGARDYGRVRITWEDGIVQSSIVTDGEFSATREISGLTFSSLGPTLPQELLAEDDDLGQDQYTFVTSCTCTSGCSSPTSSIETSAAILSGHSSDVSLSGLSPASTGRGQTEALAEGSAIEPATLSTSTVSAPLSFSWTNLRNGKWSDHSSAMMETLEAGTFGVVDIKMADTKFEVEMALDLLAAAMGKPCPFEIRRKTSYLAMTMSIATHVDGLAVPPDLLAVSVGHETQHAQAHLNVMTSLMAATVQLDSHLNTLRDCDRRRAAAGAVAAFNAFAETWLRDRHIVETARQYLHLDQLDHKRLTIEDGEFGLSDTTYADDIASDSSLHTYARYAGILFANMRGENPDIATFTWQDGKNSINTMAVWLDARLAQKVNDIKTLMSTVWATVPAPAC